jgi:hypothetical protein
MNQQLRHLDIRLYKPAKTRAMASAKIKTGKLAYEISTYLSAIGIDVWLLAVPI